MADTVCVSSPTLTSTAVSTSLSLSTTTQSTVITLPVSTITSVYTTCAASPNTTSCTTSTTLIPQRAVISTQIVTLTNTVNVPITVLQTLFGSSCATVSNTSPTTTPYTVTTPTDSTTTVTPTTTSTTTSYSTFTGTSLVITDGTTSTSYYTSISATVPVSSSSDAAHATSATSILSGLTTDPLQTNQASTSASGNNTAAIVGGTLGGIAALGLLALLTWHMIKKSHRFDDIFNKENETNYFAPPKTPPINPYQYGLVGQQETQAIGFSPPASPGLQHANLVNEMGAYNNAVGHDPGALHTNSSAPFGTGSSGTEMGIQAQGSAGNDVAYHAPNQASVHHVRNPSAVPLLVGITSAAAGAAASGHTRPNTGSSRASMASDSLGPLVTHASSQQSMGYPPQQFNSYPPALAAYAQQQGIVHPQIQQQQNLGHNASVASSSATSAAGSSTGSNFVPVGAGTRRPTSISHQSQPMHSQRYEDPFARTGSPVAYQDRQLFHVRNPEPSHSFIEGSSSMTYGTPGLSVSGALTSSDRDGKGRPLGTGGEKVPLVHLDGGAYEERSRTPAPPAYME